MLSSSFSVMTTAPVSYSKTCSTHHNTILEIVIITVTHMSCRTATVCPSFKTEVETELLPVFNCFCQEQLMMRMLSNLLSLFYRGQDG